MMPLPEDLHLNTSFSRVLPGLQLAVDSTSLGEFKTCPRKYYLSMIWGWQPKEESVHLTFGILIHEAREQYDRLRAAGTLHQDALEQVVLTGLRKTWNYELNRPWVSGSPSKNRLSFIRSVVWYLDQLGENDPIKTMSDKHGHALVELSFRFSTGKSTKAGEQIVVCGHGDRIGELNGDPYWVDVKSTEKALDARYFAQFSPNNQFSLYDVAGRVLFNLPTRGVIVDALQVGATFTRAKRHLVPRDEPLREEWLRGFGWWVDRMEDCAEQGEWPMNDKACDMYFGCQFRKICQHSPASRETWLKSDFRRRTWDPLQRRGDV